MKTKTFEVVIWLSLLCCLFVSNPAGAAGYTLTVNSLGSGTVTKNPTNASYPPGVVVTLTASADPGWYFSNWSGDTNGSVNPLNVTMNSNLAITGNFLAIPTCTLTLATNGQGTITLSPSGGSYLSNSIVTVTATPATGWVFAGWSGGTNISTNQFSLTLNSNVALTGTFAQLPALDLQPVSVTNKTGSTVNFISHAVGNAPLAYQWYFSGGNLPVTATNSTLSLTNVASGQAGNYTVIVTNYYGSITSQVAVLTLTNSTDPTNVVTTLDEASLRKAISIGGWVGLNFNGTITLTNTINITNNVILDASGVSATISGGNAVRLFYVAPGASLTASNLTFANGMMIGSGSLMLTNGEGTGKPADGGAIYDDNGNVTLVACNVTSNNAAALYVGGQARGGAVFNNSGTVALYQSSINDNSTISGGTNGASSLAASVAASDFALGGAIYNTNGTVLIIGCNLSSNLCKGLNIVTTVSNVAFFNGIPMPPIQQQATGNGLPMGGAVFQASGSMTIANSRFCYNHALGDNGFPAGPNYLLNGNPAYGGAVLAAEGIITINQSRFSGNQAIGGDAGYHNAAGPAFGGAVYSTAALMISDSSFSGNQTLAGNGTAVPQGGTKGVDGFGGAIYNSGTVVLNRSVVCSNLVQGGSASAYLGVSANGGDGWGGGIYNAAQFTATNCTIALNLVSGGNGQFNGGGTIAIGGNAFGGGLFNNTNATLTTMNLTIASNNCSSPLSSYGLNTNGTAAGSQIANTNGILRLYNSLIAGINGNTYGAITDAGYNICSDGSANFSSGSSYNFTDPKLGPLADNGGPTLCMALLPNSPAIDFGSSAGIPDTDQRGYARPFGDGPDMGAYEYGASATPPNLVVLNIVAAANNVTINYTTSQAGLFRLQASTNLTTWIDLDTRVFATPTNFSETISQQGFQSRYFRLVVQ